MVRCYYTVRYYHSSLLMQCKDNMVLRNFWNRTVSWVSGSEIQISGQSNRTQYCRRLANAATFHFSKLCCPGAMTRVARQRSSASIIKIWFFWFVNCGSDFLWQIANLLSVIMEWIRYTVMSCWKNKHLYHKFVSYKLIQTFWEHLYWLRSNLYCLLLSSYTSRYFRTELCHSQQYLLRA